MSVRVYVGVFKKNKKSKIKFCNKARPFISFPYYLSHMLKIRMGHVSRFIKPILEK